ncbi:flippase [Acidobacteriia bacterium AH_259_A11_L15]|nr:flippase [Acidobacteriia bacterium AH_259_A11_L15]
MEKLNSAVEIKGSLLLRNTALNFLGYVIPLGVAVVAIPHLIHGLGVERFGVLSLAWVVLGYFGMFDLGLGRATTRFVAEALGRGEVERLPSIVWASLILQTVLGVVGGIALIAVTPVLVEKVLSLSQSIVEETKIVFYILSVSIPIVMYTGSLRGVLEAGQRFGLVNAVKIPANSLVFLIPLFALLLGFQLPGIILFLTTSWFVTGLVYFMLVFKVFPRMKQVCINAGVLRSLLAYGGWIALCNMLVPVLIYLDRFLIASLVSVAALAYYTASYEVVSRVLIIPASFTTTLFPAFSAVAAFDKKDLARLYARSLKHMLLVMGPIAFILILFSGDILRFWLGSDFADKGALIFQILAAGMLLNGVATMAAYLLDGIGRPDLRAKIYLSYVAVYIGLAWFLISRMGIVGAALAWTLRASLELVLLFGVSWRVMRFKRAVFVENGLLRVMIAFVGLVAAISFTNWVFGKGMLPQVIATLAYLIIFVFISWRFVLDNADRNSLLAVIGRR